MVKKSFTLGLDLDGVCGNYTDEFRRFFARFKNVDPATLPEPSSWSFADSGWDVSQEEYLRLHSLAVDQGMFRSMAPMPNVSQALWKLSDAGVHIRVVTHRLLRNKQHQQVAADTCTWLDCHSIPYRDLCFTGAKSEIDADVFIDDAPHNVESLRRAGNTVIVYDHLYNRQVPGLRATNWVEAYELIAVQARAAGLIVPPFFEK